MKHLSTLFCLFLFLIISITSFAQSNGPTVKRFEDVSRTKQYARTQPRKDNNGEPAALVLVQVLATDIHVDFTANYLLGNVEKKASEYWVYMAAGAKSLEVHCAGFEKLRINFSEVSNGEITSLVKQCTYELVIALPEVAIPDGMEDIINDMLAKKMAELVQLANLKNVTQQVAPSPKPEITQPIEVRSTGWLTIAGDSTNLQGLSVEVTYNGKNLMRELPLEKMNCTSGTYQIGIKKPKYHSYHQTVEIEEGRETRICPVLVPKIYKKNSFLLAEAGLAINPSWSAGLMVGQVYGEAQAACGVGWYVKGRSAFQFQKNNSGMISDKEGNVNGKMMFYTGQKSVSMWMVNAGLVMNFLPGTQKKARNNILGLYLGAGYGKYSRLWEMTDGRWVEYGPTSASGISCGAGILGSIKGLTLILGVNTISFNYLELETGIGWAF